METIKIYRASLDVENLFDYDVLVKTCNSRDEFRTYWFNLVNRASKLCSDVRDGNDEKGIYMKCTTPSGHRQKFYVVTSDMNKTI